MLEAEPVLAQDLDGTFRAERAGLLRYFRRRVGHEAAPDMVQEVFVRAVGSQQATNLLNPTAFIRRIARNLLIDRARRRKTNNVVLFPFDDERDVSVQPDQDLTIEANELFEAYQQAVNGLPEKTRRVFLMSRDENLTYRQISSEIGITVATVEYHMMRAIAVIAVAVEAHR